MFGNLTRRVVVLGDIMLDRFLYGDARRLSPEAPVPVVRLSRRDSMAGGAGNVARNIEALGGRTTLIALAGDDAEGHELATLLGTDARLVLSAGRCTTVKLRVVAGRQQVVRVDEEQVGPSSTADETQLLAALHAALPGAGALILSDYGKGVLTETLCAEATAFARRLGVPCLVDPKGRDYTRYAGADLLTPNAAELADASGLPVAADDEAEAACRNLLERFAVGAILATRSEKGMMLVRRGAAPIAAAAMAREVFDVSGAGDTVIATLALSIAAGHHLPDAMRLANAAAGVVVGKVGTAVCSVAELEHALRNADSGSGDVLTRGDAAQLVAAWRADGLRVGFANGCFDILHAGHARMLRDARRHCDRLVVALNDDASVTRLKGKGRPVNALPDRAAVIGALASVDAVTSFAEDTPLESILALRPDRLFKGTDYTLDQVVGAREIAAWGGSTVLLTLLPGRSTTGLIKRARERD